MLNWFKNFYKNNEKTLEFDFHSKFDDIKFVNIFWISKSDKFKKSLDRVMEYSDKIYKYLKSNNFPPDSFKISILDKTETSGKKACIIEADHRYIDGSIFMELFYKGCGSSSKMLPNYNTIIGFIYLIYYLPRLLWFYFRNKTQTYKKSERNISIKKVFTIQKLPNISSRAVVLHTLYYDIMKSLKKDRLVIGVPVAFDGKNINNVGIGLLIFDKYTTPKIMEEKIKTVYTMAIATNIFDKIKRYLPFYFNIDAYKFRENLDAISTIFYYNGLGDCDTDFDFNFLPGKNVVEKMYMSGCAIKKSDTNLKLDIVVTTCYNEIADLLNKNGDYVPINQEYLKNSVNIS